jgi:uncharacterized OB-fold protein
MSDVLPLINRLNAPFWAGAEDGRLMLPYCTATSRAFWPPSPISPFAEGGAVEWREVEPVGEVKATAAYRRVFHQAFAPLMPFAIALVELDAGPRLQAHVPRADDAGAPKAGDRVTLVFRRILPDGPPVPIAEAINIKET